MFNNVLRCLVSRATISDWAAADSHIAADSHNAAWIGDNATGIGDNAAGIGGNAAGIGDNSKSGPMLNYVLNRDWSNSVPGRQFPKGNVSTATMASLQPSLQSIIKELPILG